MCFNFQVQDTKWKGEKVRDLNDEFKLFFAGKYNSGNGVGIIIEGYLRDKIIRMKTKNGRIL